MLRTLMKGDVIMRDDNHGISLVEILAVISILAILASGGISIYRQLRFGDTKEAAVRIDAAMAEIRMETMCKDQKLFLYLYSSDGAVYMKKSTEASEAAASLTAASGIKLSDRINLSYRIASSGEADLEPGAALCISFERSSGIFDTDLEFIKVRSAEHVTEITCIPETGRHWVD